MKFLLANPFKTGRIPTLLGLVLLLTVVGITVVASQAAGNLTRFFSAADTASGINSPLQVSNVTDTSFTLSWTTEKESIGRAFVGTSANALTAAHNDVRDASGTVKNYLTHYVRVNNLTANTEYFVKVGEAGPEFGTDQGDALSITTWSALKARTLNPIFGTVKNKAGSGQSGAIVLWEAEGAESLSALTTKEGSYVIAVALARSTGGESWYPFETTTAETLTISSGVLSSTVMCDSSLDRPVPDVVIGENKSCQLVSKTSNDTDLSASNSARGGFTPPTGGASSLGGSSAQEVELNIEQGQTVNNPQPTISGKVGPNETISITVHSDSEYSATVRANPDGTWSWTPPGNLSPGEHTVTIEVTHTDGTVTTETRTFFVSGGNDILPITAGTPSATPKHLACINNACTQVEGEGSDECANSNDCTLALPPPIEEPPTPPPVVVVPPKTPTTGAFENTIIVLTLGFGLLTLGAGVFIKENQR